MKLRQLLKFLSLPKLLLLLWVFLFGVYLFTNYSSKIACFAEEIVEKIELHIGGVFPMEAGSGGWPGGQACLPAVQMALEDINKNLNILPNYALRLHYFNSKCLPGLASKQLFELLYKSPIKLILLSGCSPVTTIVAEAAPVWNLIVLSYGASSPALSNRPRFPTLFRTHPSANMQNPTRVHLFEKFKWKKITILQSVEEVFTSTAKDLEELSRLHSIRVERQSFYGDPTDAVKTLVRQDARIIVGLFYVTEARKVLCQAYQHGLYGRRYVWFFIGWYAETWYIPPKDEEINCTKEQMEKAAEYHFTTESIMLSRDNNPAISGMTGKEFQQRLTKMIETDPGNTGGFPEAPLAYDAIWALALALNCTKYSLPYGVFLEDFSYNNSIIAEQMFECVKNTQFKGVSGQVMFSDSGDRIARTQIEQMQNGKYVVLGFYDTTKGQTLEWFNNQKFADGRGAPPDSTIIKHSFITLNLTLYSVVLFFAFIGIILAIISFIFNRHYSTKRIIVQSQPQCNNLLIGGSLLCLLSLPLMGLPAGNIVLPNHLFALMCHTRVAILMLGFTFAYGSLFAKIWIVHRMGASESQEIASKDEATPWDTIRTLLSVMVGKQAATTALRKISSHAYDNLIAKKNCLLNQPIQIEKFYTVVGSLFFIDFILIFSWLILDPFQRQQKTFHLQFIQEAPVGTEEDVMLLPILELCQSSRQEIWIVLVLGYKGLLIIFGLFLAFESRHLKLRYVNDSRFVFLAVCNVSVLSLLTGPIVTFFLRTQADAFFIFVSATVLLCTYMSMGLIFLPKMIHLYKTPNSPEENYGGVGRRCGISNSYANSSTLHNLSSNYKSDQNRFQQLIKENSELKRQIELRKTKILECRKLVEKYLKKDDDLQMTTFIINDDEITDSTLISLNINSGASSGTNNNINNNNNIFLPTTNTLMMTNSMNQMNSAIITSTTVANASNTIQIELGSSSGNCGRDTGICSDFEEDENEYKKPSNIIHLNDISKTNILSSPLNNTMFNNNTNNNSNVEVVDINELINIEEINLFETNSTSSTNSRSNSSSISQEEILL